MARVLDVAAYILKRQGPMVATKLQKLVYYAQAWSLVWDEKPLFNARIEAWANGPVVPELYRVHRLQYEVTGIPGADPSRLADNERETIDAVLTYYGDKPPMWLSELTHAESPWKDARKGLAPGDRSTREIPLSAMSEYYESLLGVENT